MVDLAAHQPLTPSTCDLTDFPFMPLDVRRLLSSETWILGNGDERAAAMCLWLESWHQVPAGSLPDNDRMLAHLAQCPKWNKVREHALRGWVKCSDGRLYHPVVAEKALEAWVEKLLNSISGASGNAKRWGVDVDIETPRKQLIEAVESLRKLAPQSRALKKKAVAIILAGSPPDSPPDSPGDRKGQGQGQGQGQGLKELSTPDGVLVGAAHQPDPPGDSDEPDRSKPKIPACPAQTIVDLYHEILPELPQVALLNDSRRRHLQGRWREHEAHRSLEFWRDLFETIRASPFLMGKTPGRNGGTPFRATFDWIIAPTNFVKIVEGNYHA